MVTADGPGRHVTGNPASAQAATSLNPGSLTDGIPASVMSSTVEPAPIASTSFGVRAASTWS
ncbi:hypothetical protein D7316_01766 [Gordonia insulae]|uniref:Uncharacterized protein n=1 Tax=Gordonia insulae TaxID=2420509 RepID=A0A3G8JKV4_9ACTN|nr:hypothetical protein D7316_01766 [Gordonia insulae]